MGYVADNILCHLPHNDGAVFFAESILRKCIWYSATQEAYSQRTTIFDGSWLEMKSSNTYVFLTIKRVLKLDEIRLFDTVDLCHKTIDALPATETDKDLLYLYYNKLKAPSLFTEIIESLRNGSAHGTFNVHDDCFFMISQGRAKPESSIKFYLKTKQDINSKLMELFAVFEKMVVDPIVEKYNCLLEVLDLKKMGEKYFSEILHRYIVIDDSFSYTSSSYKKDIKSRLESSDLEENTIVIVNENLSNIAEKNLKDTVKNVEMTTIKRLLDKLSIATD